MFNSKAANKLIGYRKRIRKAVIRAKEKYSLKIRQKICEGWECRPFSFCAKQGRGGYLLTIERKGRYPLMTGKKATKQRANL